MQKKQQGKKCNRYGIRKRKKRVQVQVQKKVLANTNAKKNIRGQTSAKEKTKEYKQAQKTK